MAEGALTKSQTEVEEEAAVWIWRLDSEAVTEQIRLALEAWLAEDPRHTMAFHDLSEAWAALERLAKADKHSS